MVLLPKVTSRNILALVVIPILLAGFLLPNAESAQRTCAQEEGYSPVWWLEVDKSSAPKWEILPHEAPCGTVVLSKRNELGVFSNLAPTPLTYDGAEYASVEGLWQMMKYPESDSDPRHDSRVRWRYTRAEVARMSGFESKAAGDLANENMKKLGIKWVTYKGERIAYKGDGQARHYEIVSAAMREKVKQNPHIAELLLSTGELNLWPDHQQEENVPPAYRYHDIYMTIRNELK